MVFYPTENLHDFVVEPVNPEHSFHDAHTVPFCLTADHISACLTMFSARFKTAQFWSVLIRGEWKCSICSYQRRWCGVPSRRTGVDRARVEAWQPPWSPLDSPVWTRGWWSVSTAGNGCSRMQRFTVSRQLATDAVVCTASQCHDSWQRMQWYATSHSVSTAGNGCSGMHRLSVSRQLATDAVVCNVPQCLDILYWIQRNALESRSSEVSALFSGRLGRMVSEVFGKHLGDLYSSSTTSSSFVSPSVASLSHCESFHQESAWFKFLVWSRLFCLRLVSSTCHPCLLDR